MDINNCYRYACHGDSEQDQQADEKLRGSTLQICHKIHDNVEDGDLHKDQRNVNQRLGNRVG